MLWQIPNVPFRRLKRHKEKPMKTEFLWVCILSIAAISFKGETAESPSSPIVLSDGSKITFLGITYGKHNVAPNYEAIGGHIQSGNWIDRPNDVAVAWIEIEHKPDHWPSYSLLVSDMSNANSVRAETSTRSHVREGLEVHGFELRAYPRWDRQFYLCIADPYGKPVTTEKFLVTNPERKEMGNPIPETLPVTKTNGDLTVSLTNLVTGAPRPPYDRRADIPATDSRSQCVRVGFDLEQNGHAATNWHPWVVTLTDALSNRVNTTMQFQDNEFMRHHWRGTPFVVTPADEYRGYIFHPGLWRSEAAWNIRIEFTRDSGFDEDEILSLTNLPVREGTKEEYDNEEWSWEPGQTDHSIGNYTLNGIKLKLFPPLLLPDPDHAGQKRLHVLMRANPDPREYRMTLLEATNEEGRKLWAPFVTAWYNCTMEFPSVGEVKTLNLKFALHRSRFVTFTVKPNRQ